MIRRFRHKGIEHFFKTGSKARIQPKHATKLELQLGLLDTVKTPQEMNVPAWRLHALQGHFAGHWAVWVNGNWRLTFQIVGEDVELVDDQDYHEENHDGEV